MKKFIEALTSFLLGVAIVAYCTALWSTRPRPMPMPDTMLTPRQWEELVSPDPFYFRLPSNNSYTNKLLI